MISNVPTMRHRNYDIQIFSTGNLAIPRDGVGPELLSRYANRIGQAIDRLHDAFRILDDDALSQLDVESIPAPKWLRNWMLDGGRRIDLDRAHGQGEA